MMTHARYLGDGVYAKFDGHGIVLTTGSHLDRDADNRIVMEPEVAQNFVRYLGDLHNRLKANPNENPIEI